jgi:hypothetical protein
MVSVQLRLLPVLLALAESVTVLLPLPLMGDTVSQLLHGLLTVHEHALDGGVTLTVVLPPQAAMLPLVGVIG